MAIEFGLTNEISNTQYAPLAALLAHYHQEKVLIMMKGNSNRRAHLWAQQVTRWDPCGDVFLAEIPSPIKFNRPVRIFLKKRVKNEQICVSYYISTIKLPSKRHFISYYDNRGAAEIEQFRNDKMGLHLASRRKTLFLAQKISYPFG
ncbi:hypothetical protein KFU94_00280 [Chloroflexi bacterium TSY]|nr:hypothetical protein [Chloroflexi bacterium TSY]